MKIDSEKKSKKDFVGMFWILEIVKMTFLCRPTQTLFGTLGLSQRSSLVSFIYFFFAVSHFSNRRKDVGHCFSTFVRQQMFPSHSVSNRIIIMPMVRGISRNVIYIYKIIIFIFPLSWNLYLEISFIVCCCCLAENFFLRTRFAQHWFGACSSEGKTGC